MNKYALLFFLTTFSAFAEIPYTILDSSYVQKGEEINITPVTPIKAQDGIGLCYGFSATSLLENFRCRELNLNCNDPHEFLSTLDVTSYFERERLIEGGQTFRILNNLENGRKKIAREECIKFSTLVHQMADNQNNIFKDEKRGWIFLTKKWNEYRGIGGAQRNDCASCLADTIKSTLVNIQTPADQIKNAFYEAHTLEEFLYKTLLPAQCLQDSKMADMPAFVSKTWPGYNDKFSEEALMAKIENVLRNNIPVEIGICTSGLRPCGENSGHSIALFGIKEVCSNQTNECRKVVKIKNSYGMSWQLQNNDGWIDLKALAEASHNLAEYQNISWIQRPGQVLSEKKIIAPPPQNRPATPSAPGIPNEYKNYRGIWKCPNSRYTDQYEPGCVPARI